MARHTNDPWHLTKREEAQLRRTLELLNRIREERTRDLDDDREPSYCAALAQYHLEDYLHRVKLAREAEHVNAMHRAITGENTNAVEPY